MDRSVHRVAIGSDHGGFRLKESLKPFVLRKKKLEQARHIAADARAALAPGDSVSAVTRTTAGVTIQTTGPFTLGGSIPGIGRDMSFFGTTAALAPGQISPAFAGVRGAYLVQLLSTTGFDSSAYTAQKEVLRSRMLQEKKSRFLTEWLGKLREQADIEDHRDTFYR